MTIAEVQENIKRLKKEKNICILAHAYQNQEIWEVADHVGDSFGLSVKAAASDCDTIIMCGVRFMAETAKILSPEKKVFLPSFAAECPMAEQMDIELLGKLKEEMSDYSVVAYINTSAELKTMCDVCVTSSSAVKIIKKMRNDKILFIPDCNLGDYISKRIPEKEIRLVHGGCPTHIRISAKDVDTARKKHPHALVLVHPECLPNVTEKADFIGSTTEIMDFAEAGSEKEYMIGTENSIVEHLQFMCPDKRFYPLSKDCVCHNMQATTLMDVYNCAAGLSGEEIAPDKDILLRAGKCIKEMIRLGK